MEEDTAKNLGGAASSHAYVQDVARYLKAFLETGLQASLRPSRQVTVKRSHGLATQLYLDAYPQLNKNLYKNFTAGLAQEVFVVSQNKYTKHVDERLSEGLAQAITAVDKTATTGLVTALARSIDAARVQHHQDAAAYTAEAAAATEQVFVTALIAPIVRGSYGVATPENDAASQVLITMGAAKMRGLFGLVLDSIAARYAAEELSFEQLTAALANVITPPILRAALDEFLEEFNQADAYHELYNIHLANQSLETSDVSLYFGEIATREARFPLFYTPLRVSHAYPSVTIEFGNTIFVNTKALDAVRRTYSHVMGQDIAFIEALPDAIEIDPAQRKEVLPKLQNILNVLVETFGITKQLNLESALDQTVGELGISLNNRVQIAVFDKATDGLVHDYAQLLENPKSKAGAAFTELVQAYAHGTPVRYVQEVAEEWNAKTLTERLVATNPLPLSDEQKHVTAALAKKDANVVVVDGAPGTGKSHLAAALTMESLVAGHTTLVLSRTPAALETMHQTITGALGEVRGNKGYHNPLLRLGQPVEPLLEALEKPYLEKLTAYHQTYTKLQGELVTAKNRKIKETAETITGLVQTAENINLQEVEQTVANEIRFSSQDWVRDEPIDEISPILQKLHQAIGFIRGSEANYLLPYIEQSQQEAIGQFIEAIREYERASKNVIQREPQFVIHFRKLSAEEKAALQASLSYIHSNYRQYVHILREDAITTQLKITDNSPYEAVRAQQLILEQLVDLAKDAKRFIRGDKTRASALVDQLISYSALPEEVIAALTNYIEQVISLKSKIFGFSGRTLVVENLTRQLKKIIPEFSIDEPEKRLDDLQTMVDLTEFVSEQLTQLSLPQDDWKQVLHLLLAEPSRVKELQKIIASLVEPAGFEFMRAHRIYEADNLLANVSLLDYATQLNSVLKAHPSLATLFGIKSIGQVLAQPQIFRSRFDKLATDLDDVKQLDEAKQVIKDFIKTYPVAAKRLGVNYANGTLDIITDTFAGASLDDLKEYLTFKKKEQDIVQYFKELTTDGYGRSMSDLRQMTLTQLSHSLDARALTFAEQQAEDFARVKEALRAGRRFDTELLRGVLQLFPAVLADVRDYADYLPLHANLFDLLVIDEASGVSIAEALPAILRAKKVVVIGEGDALSNEAAPRIDAVVNDMHRSNIAQAFGESLKDTPADTKNQLVQRLKTNIDAHSSVLGFARPIAGSEVRLTQYVRSSPQLIAYVNTQFYGGSLKCLRARTLPLTESIKLEYVKPAGDAAFSLHTNASEVQTIINTLTEMRDNGFTGSIGIVTPYHEQAVLLQRELDECVISDWFAQRQLKVMTFDTARGQERDYVLYSLVATPAFDTYSDTLPSLTAESALLEREQLRDSFSIARETVHFILSKPADAFSGELAHILEEFQAQLTPPTVKTGNVTDILQAAESLFPQYFYATKFYKKHGDKARLVTQFSLGDILKPLAPAHEYPGYKVDFLVAFGDQRVVITYDEFKEQFLASHIKNTELYTNYLTAEDIYNQKLLENYGYSFLHFNKFNLGSRPTEVLDKYLTEVTRVTSWPKDNGFLE